MTDMGRDRNPEGLTYTTEIASQANGWVGIKKYMHVGGYHVWALWSRGRPVLYADVIKGVCHGNGRQSMSVNSRDS